MRELTLHEKISIKGVLSQRGLILPKLNMSDSIHYWKMVFGPYNKLSKWYKIRKLKISKSY